MGVDELVRWGLVLAMSGLALVCLIGGWLTPVAGCWQDGDRRIEVTQLGPWVRGSCQRPGGGETYKGTALFGVVRLQRFEYGTAHLEAMGFDPRVAFLVLKRPTARLQLRREGDALRGTFVGRRFTFSPEPPSIRAVVDLEPAERVWLRRV